jgi:hypothetical protein
MMNTFGAWNALCSDENTASLYSDSAAFFDAAEQIF